MNKRGHIPTILLFVVAIVVCGFALFSFVSFDRSFDDSSDAFSVMMGKVDFIQEYIMMRAGFIGTLAIQSGDDFEGEFQRLAVENDFDFEDADVFFKKIEDGDFSFVNVEGEYSLEIRDLVIEVEVDGNVVKRKFDVVLVFDADGEVKNG